MHAPEFEITVPPLPVTDSDLAAMADFLTAAVTQEVPQLTLPALTLRRPGWIVDVMASTEERVTLEWQVLPQLGTAASTQSDGDGPESDGVNFETSRLALLHAAAQFRGQTPPGTMRHRLFTARTPGLRALLWQRIGLPDLSRLNGVLVPTADRPTPAGEVAVVRGYSITPGADAEVELELLRQRIPGDPVGMLGTYPDGERFGLLILWHESFGPAAAPEADVLAAAERLVAETEREAVFAELDGSFVVSRAGIRRHLAAGYRLDRAAIRALTAGSFPQLVQGLVAEAVGVPLPTFLTAAGCLFPGREHRCQGDPLNDALAAWLDGLASPEQFDAFPPPQAGSAHAGQQAEEGTPAAEPAPHGGGFESRFAAFLGPPELAPECLQSVFDFARRADEADRVDDDRRVRAALQAAIPDIERLLAAGPPSGSEPGLRELLDQLIFTFGEKPGDEVDG